MNSLVKYTGMCFSFYQNPHLSNLIRDYLNPIPKFGFK